MATLSQTAYIINSNICIDGTQVFVDCSKVTAQETAYFVLVNNEFPDGCGGFLEVGAEITEIQTLGHESNTFIQLLHVVGNGNDIWISSTKQEFIDACVCCVGGPVANYNFSTGLTNDANTITSDLSTGVSGGQSVIGGTDAGDNLTLSSTVHATKGKIIFADDGDITGKKLIGLIEQIDFYDPNTGITAQTYVLELYAFFGYTIDVLKIKCGSGTATAALQINGTNVTSISAVAVSNTIASATATGANTVAIGNVITLVISSPTALNQLQVSIQTTRTA